MDDKDIIKRIAVEVMGWREITEPMQDHEIWRTVRESGVSHWVIDFGGRFIVFDVKPQKERPWNPLEDIRDAFEMESRIFNLGWFPQYRVHLGLVVVGPGDYAGLLADDAVDRMLQATARQRCEAAIRMLEVKA